MQKEVSRLTPGLAGITEVPGLDTTVVALRMSIGMRMLERRVADVWGTILADVLALRLTLGMAGAVEATVESVVEAAVAAERPERKDVPGCLDKVSHVSCLKL